MSSQKPLFGHETWREAFKDMVAEIGGAKAMAAAMWPKKDPEQGARTINDWLNPNRREMPDFDEIQQMLLVGRERGVHTGIEWICNQLNYTKPTPVAPEERIAALMSAIDQKAGELEGALSELRLLRKQVSDQVPVQR